MVLRPRRPEASAHKPEILAGLRGQPCPPGGNAFTHLEASFPHAKSRHWPAIVAAFRSLPRATRRRIVRRHREERGLIPDPRELFRDPDYLDWPR